MTSQASLRERLVARLCDQLSVLSVTGEEDRLCSVVAAEQAASGAHVARHGNSLVLTRFTPEDTRPLVLLVGHLDVVPPTKADAQPTVLDDRVIGRGSSDMKAGNTLALELFGDVALLAASPFRVAVVLYAGEEGPASGNELPLVLDAEPWLTKAALAIVLEPTDSRMQLGCLGGLHAELTFDGVAAHSARPWDGDNAIYKAHTLLRELALDHVRDVTVDGIAFCDVWSVTRAYSAGFGPDATAATPVRNVIPDRFTLNVNFRFAPSRSLAAAEQELIDRVAGRAAVSIVDRAAPAAPNRDTPLVAQLVSLAGGEVTGKQAWTDIARFAEVGVPGVNFGPGLTTQAHQAGEFVLIDDMVSAFTLLHRFLAGEQ